MQKEKIKMIPCDECISYALCKHKLERVCETMYTYLQKSIGTKHWYETRDRFSLTQEPLYFYCASFSGSGVFILFNRFSEQFKEHFLTVLKDGEDGMKLIYSDKKVRLKPEDAVWSWFQQSGISPFDKD